MSTCDHPMLESLVLFTDGSLPPLEVQEISVHIDGCPDCALEVAVATQLRDLEAENLISYPGPARREAGARRLRSLASNVTGEEPGQRSQPPAGFGPFEKTTLLGGVIGLEAFAHLLGPAAESALPVGDLMAYEPGLKIGSGGEEAGTHSGEPSLAAHAPEPEKNLDHDVRLEDGMSSRSPGGDIPKHDGLDSLIDEARALFADQAGIPGHEHDDDPAGSGHWCPDDDLTSRPYGSHSEEDPHRVDSTGLADPTELPDSSQVGPDGEPGHHEDRGHSEDRGHDTTPDDHHLHDADHDHPL